ncbi:hypothetical protein TWF173_005649 [Orbilia oligospora]|uniref:Uncharacterized protein n=1 Tax=Orbilia oligospora TaxID=2813651 RepID=A0A7C8RD48_ORBOL|nr:hypothetical protein TWF970_011246 [Orbilia oligospora]KAF3313818.1 hypothetical protein TWF173_005649 [Orbilia oligospora]
MVGSDGVSVPRLGTCLTPCSLQTNKNIRIQPRISGVPPQILASAGRDITLVPGPWRWCLPTRNHFASFSLTAFFLVDPHPPSFIGNGSGLTVRRLSFCFPSNSLLDVNANGIPTATAPPFSMKY